MKLRWLILSLAAPVLVAGTGYAWLARSQRGCAPGTATAVGTECESLPSGAARGSSDPVMSGACRFSCATKTAYEEKDVIAQPGAMAGRLTLPCERSRVHGRCRPSPRRGGWPRVRLLLRPVSGAIRRGSGSVPRSTLPRWVRGSASRKITSRGCL